MKVFIFKILGEEISAFTWSKDIASGIHHAKILAKNKGYMKYKLVIV